MNLSSAKIIVLLIILQFAAANEFADLFYQNTKEEILNEINKLSQFWKNANISDAYIDAINDLFDAAKEKGKKLLKFGIDIEFYETIIEEHSKRGVLSIKIYNTDENFIIIITRDILYRIEDILRQQIVATFNPKLLILLGLENIKKEYIRITE